MSEQDATRTGGEANLQQELKEDDAQVGQPVADDPGGDGDALRRSRFVDLHADEDGDPTTTEATAGQ